MCYAIPGKLVEVKDKIGIVDYFGEKRRVVVDYVDVNIGDYVYAQGGVLINKVPPKEAEEVLAAWKEIFLELQNVDKDMARVKEGGESKRLLEVLQKANIGRELSKEDLLFLLRLKNKDDLQLLYQTANNTRHKEHKNACCVHGIIEFSNYCRNECFYCGIRGERSIERYRMDVGEIVETARHAVSELKFKALVLQSGEDIWYDDEKLVTIVREIRKMQVLIFLSLGSREKDTYKKLYDAGARAALLRFETSNPDIFRQLRPGKRPKERLEIIRYLKSLGYIVATGFLIGLPGETEEGIIDNILLTRSLRPDMYSFGPFVPVKETPLGDAKPVDCDIVLKTIAISRIADKQAKILVTTALETLDKRARKDGLLAGASSLMINITPEHYRNLYRIYDNRAGTGKDVKQEIRETVELLHSLGRAPTDLGI